ncbi:HK97 gp10 family phage protein [Butyricicoccus porcorum]|uniref:HK97 gp10 family phage protein n=1 Tax=Butyricicoccus porcorum TaxID=1945634 RepID=A0A252F5W6_9FIRM|nr:HK97 gp10 family phage protein [Butyricicoccus porcorum]MDY4974026.1 HK97 gp10 family phage protein [Eubacteriales bacterium]OUM21178.1 hypothetical protein CBW42_03850 [Butyricicoccus porcorum]
MAKKITVDRLSDEIMDALEEYKEMTDEVVQTAVDTVSKETKKLVQAGSPVQTGGYQKGWAVKKTSAKAGQVSITVYNRKKPGLTHLLEKGHAKRGGGRVAGQPHIAPAEQYAVSELENKIKRGLS